MNSFYKISNFLDRMQKAEGGKALDIALFECFDDNTIENNGMDVKFKILSTLEECIDLASSLKLADHRISQMLSRVKGAKHMYLMACVSQNAAQFNGQMSQFIDIFASFGDTVDQSNRFCNHSLDRVAFLKSTAALIDTLNTSVLPEIEKEALEIKLRAIQRVIVECKYMSDSQIRHRVKSIYADLRAQFDENDKKYQGVFEKVLGWARPATGAGLFALALTADATAVVPKLLGPPG